MRALTTWVEILVIFKENQFLSSSMAVLNSFAPAELDSPNATKTPPKNPGRNANSSPNLPALLIPPNRTRQLDG
jgi:hypothetical protein